MHHMVFPINGLPACQTVEGGIDDILWNADLKFEAMKRYQQVIDSDVLSYVSDATIQAEAMGAAVRYSRHAMPAVCSPSTSLNVPNPAKVPRMRVNAQVLRQAEKEFPDTLRAGMLNGPFTVAGQAAGEQTILKGLTENPTAVMDVLKKTYECTERYARCLVESGANLLWISDPSAALIPPDQFWDFSGVFLRRIFDLFPSLPTILHICGDTSRIVRDMVNTGVKGISFDNCMDLLAVEDELPEETFIIGNIDPIEVIELGSREEIIYQTSDLVSVMGLKDNFVLSTGCAVPPNAPLENVRLFVEHGRRCMSDRGPHISMLLETSTGVYSGDRSATRELVSANLDAGIEPLTVVTRALTRGIRKGSAMYEAKKCFLPSVLLMADAFYQGYQLLQHGLESYMANKPAVMLCTVKGDIHEIGKNLVGISLETHGYKVIDLGVDVAEGVILESYQKHMPAIIGLSAFTSSSRKQIVKVIELFHKEGLNDVLFIAGGAAMNHEVSRAIGANGYARDALRAVRLVETLLKQAGKHNQ